MRLQDFMVSHWGIDMRESHKLTKWVALWLALFVGFYIYGNYRNYSSHLVHTKEGTVWYYAYDNDGKLQSYQVK